MKRKDIIIKLVKEGLTEKTLVNMTDRQLKMLAERLLSEQYATSTTTTAGTNANSPSILNIPKANQPDITAAKQQKKILDKMKFYLKEEE